MDQLAVLRKIRARVGGDQFTKLEIGRSDVMDPMAEDESYLIVFEGEKVFEFLVKDEEWESPGTLIEQVVEWVHDH